MKPVLVIFIFITVIFDSYSQAGKNIELINFRSSECEPEHHLYSVKNRIISKEFKDGIYYIKIGVVANCCYNEHGTVGLSHDTLILNYLSNETYEIDEKGDTIGGPYESFCDCDCCFSFEYEIKGLEDKEYIIYADTGKIELSTQRYYTKPIKFDIIDGDTLNYFDMYGFRQGLHIRFDEQNRISAKIFYKDDEEINESVYIKYYETGEVLSKLLAINGSIVGKIEYYKNGMIKKECKDGPDKKTITCKEYDETGKLINN